MKRPKNIDLQGMQLPESLSWTRHFRILELYGVSFLFLVLIATIYMAHLLGKLRTEIASFLKDSGVMHLLTKADGLIDAHLADLVIYQTEAAEASAEEATQYDDMQKPMIMALERFANDTELEGYYIVAHGRGSVIAFKAVMEAPNRNALLRKCLGFLTVGSPLNKFAALWPWLVPIANAGLDQRIPWVNVVDMMDIVAGKTDLYEASPTSKSVGGLVNGRASDGTGDRDFVWSDQRNLLRAHTSYWKINNGNKDRLINRLATWLEGGPWNDPCHTSPAFVTKMRYVLLVSVSAVALIWILATLIRLVSLNVLLPLLGVFGASFAWAICFLGIGIVVIFLRPFSHLCWQLFRRLKGWIRASSFP